MNLRVVASLVVGLVLFSCESVSVIRTVAAQNDRNARALQKNLDTFLSENEKVFRSWVAQIVSGEYRDVLLGIRNPANKPGLPDLATVSTHFQNRAATHRTFIDAIGDEAAKAREIARLLKKDPLAAEVAFADMEPDIAAGKWSLIDTIFHLTGKTSEERFVLAHKEIRDLTPITDVEAARAMVLQAYAGMVSALREQSSIGVEIAGQLRTASQASGSPGTFLGGVIENDQLLGQLGQIVRATTNDPDKIQLADALIAALKEDETGDGP
jgi:hypothetical protein